MARSSVRSCNVAGAGGAGRGARSGGRVRWLRSPTGIVIGYIASVLMSVGILLILLKNGW